MQTTLMWGLGAEAGKWGVRKLLDTVTAAVERRLGIWRKRLREWRMGQLSYYERLLLLLVRLEKNGWLAVESGVVNVFGERPEGSLADSLGDRIRLAATEQMVKEFSDAFNALRRWADIEKVAQTDGIQVVQEEINAHLAALAQAERERYRVRLSVAGTRAADERMWQYWMVRRAREISRQCLVPAKTG